MSIGSRIKERREQLHLSRNELADKNNVTPSAIANYLHQDEMKNLQYKDKATPEEFENIIKKYRNLDSFGRESVDTVFERETERVKQLREIEEKMASLVVRRSRVRFPSAARKNPLRNQGIFVFLQVICA